MRVFHRVLLALAAGRFLQVLASTEISLFMPDWDFDRTDAILREFRKLNSTKRDFPNTTFNKMRGEFYTDDRVASIRSYINHRNPGVRSSIDILLLDVIHVPQFKDELSDLYTVMPGGRSWFTQGNGHPRLWDFAEEAFHTGGQQLGIPDSIEVGVLFYRKDLMKRYGLCTCNTTKCRALTLPMWDCDPPETWDELERMATIIQAEERNATGNNDFWGFIFQAVPDEILTCRAMEFFATFAAADPILSGQGLGHDPVVLLNGTVVVNGSHTVAALRRMQGWMKTISPPDMAKDWDYMAMATNFKEGNAAFAVGLSAQVAAFNADDSPVVGNFSAGLIPGVLPGLGRGCIGGNAYAMTKQTDDLPAAVAVLQFLAGRDAYEVKEKEPFNGGAPAVWEFSEPNRPPDMCKSRCPTCMSACDFNFSDWSRSYTVWRPAKQTVALYEKASRIVFETVLDVLNFKLGPEAAAEHMQCKIVETLQGKGALPPPCMYVNPCGSGHTFSGGLCTPCTPGMYASINMERCLPCKAGRAAPGHSSSACANCKPGTFSAFQGAAFCTNCSVGRFQRRTEQQDCEPCPPGFVQPRRAQETCEACFLRSYAQEQECVMCPEGRTTLSRGAANLTDCVCDVGYYSSGGMCLRCQKGLDCQGGSNPPMSQEGFHAGARADFPPEAFEGVSTEFSVFQCPERNDCPPGHIGVCTAGRHGIVCSECSDGLVPVQKGGCAECSAHEKVFAVLTLLAVMGGVVFAYKITERDEHNGSKGGAPLMIALTGGMLITSVQQLGIIATLEVQFPSSVVPVLQTMTAMMDINILRLECFMPLAPLQDYYMRIARIVLLLFVAFSTHAVFVVVHHHGKFCARMHRLIFVTGTILTVFLISFVNTSILPFQMVRHPNGLRTLQRYPSVIAWEMGDHTMMVTMGIVVLTVPIGFLTVCGMAVYQLPAKMQQGETLFLQAYAFLFNRFHPEMYWYILPFIARNFIIALVPIIPDVPMQISIISGILLASMVFTAVMLPWRVRQANFADILITYFTVSFSAFCAFFVNKISLEGLSQYAAVFIALVFITPWFFMAYAGVRHVRLINAKPYKFFLCHHKAGAGALARYLKGLLLEVMGSKSARKSWSKRKHSGRAAAAWLVDTNPKQSVFIDTDNLMNLDLVFEIVASSVETVIAIESKHLLLQPWCLGELATAYCRKVDTIRLTFPDFVAPDDTFIQSFAGVVDTASLAPHGFDSDLLQTMLVWLQQQSSVDLPEVVAPRSMLSVAFSLVHGTVRTGTSVTAKATKHSIVRTPSSSDTTDLLIVPDYSSSEAAAAALELSSSLKQHLDGWFRMKPVILLPGETLPPHTDACVFALSNGCFQQPFFVQALVDAAQLEVKGLPVIVEDGFTFPVTAHAQDAIRLLVQTTPAISKIVPNPETLVSIINCLFKEIAISFATQYSGRDVELMVKARSIAKRLLSPNLHRLTWPGDEEVSETVDAPISVA